MKTEGFRCNKYTLIYLAIAAFYFWMAAQIPYTHDDWDWGLAIGMEQFLHATVNSRYAGNFFEIVMTRSELLKVVIMGATYFLIPYLLVCVAVSEQEIVEPKRKLLLFLLCNCMLLTMNHIMWREVYGWVAGFANFAISAVFLIPWIKDLCSTLDSASENQKDSSGKLMLYFVISFCGQLFVENLAIYCVVLACLLCGIHYFKSRRIPYRILVMSIGAVGGLIIMFSSSIYKTLFATGSAVGNVRSIPILLADNVFGGIYELMIMGLNLGRELYANNIVLTTMVLGVFIVWMQSGKSMANKHFCKKATFTNFVLLIAFVLCHIYDRICKNHLTVVYLLDFIVSISYFLAIGVEAFHCFRKEKRGKVLTLWMSPPVLIAPLLVTTEVGQRLFFTTNIFVLIVMVLAFAEMIDTVSAVTQKKVGCGIVCAALLLVGFYGRIYVGIGECKEEREAIIREAVETELVEIALPSFPHQEYLHEANPVAAWRVPYFKEFYGIPDTVEVKFE